MAKFPKPFDFEASEAVRLAPSDSDEAARALLIAAKYIREGRQLPDTLDTYLADAIEFSMLKPKGYRNTAFLRELHLEAENRRPAKAHWVDAGHRVADLIEHSGYTQNKAADTVAAEFNVSRSTAKRLYKEWLGAVEVHERELRNLDNE